MPKGEDTRYHSARIVSLDAHRAKKPKPSMMERVKKTLGLDEGSYNTDLDDPNTPEYTGQQARLSDLAPRNLIDKAKGGTGKVEKKPLFGWNEKDGGTFRGKAYK